MSKLEFIVYGDPVPKARPRMTKTGHVYTPARTKQFEFLVQQVWAGQKNRKMMTGPISVSIMFVLSPPSNPKKRPHPTGKPDLDNLIKSVLDGLNGWAFKDDSQVTDLICFKRFCGKNEKPKTKIVLEELYKEFT